MEKLFNYLVGFTSSPVIAVIIASAFLALGFVCLVKGSDWFVDGSVGIASRFGIPQMVIGLTVVAMGTSAPEAAVSITGAFNDAADTAVGNILGSNILNILIILGLAAVFCPLKVDRTTVKVDTPVLIAISILLFVLGIDGTISLLDGIILLVVFLAYMFYLVLSSVSNKSSRQEISNGKPMWLTLILTLIGLAVVILGSQLAVTGATAIARSAGIKESFIGLTVVALGTSLPELFTSVSAAKKGNADIAIGNIVGSNIFNILLVLGISGIVTPVAFASSFLVDCAVSVAVTFVLFVFCITKRRISRIEGVLLLCGYGAYFTYLIVNIK